MKKFVIHPYFIATIGTVILLLITAVTKNSEAFLIMWFLMIFTVGGGIGLKGSDLNFTPHQLKRNTHIHGIFGISLAIISLIMELYNLEMVSLILHMYIGLAVGHIIRNYTYKKRLDEYQPQ